MVDSMLDADTLGASWFTIEVWERVLGMLERVVLFKDGLVMVASSVTSMNP